MMMFGDLIKQKGLSVPVLAKQLGVDESSVYAWRRRGKPSPKLRAKVEKHLGVKGIVFVGDSPATEAPSSPVERPKTSIPTFRELMDSRGLSQRGSARAEELGASVTAISHWRDGKTPSAAWQKRIKVYFGVNEIDFESSRDEPKPTHESTPAPSSGEGHTIAPSEEHTLMQVIRMLGFEEALKRLVR